jgi:hypothetical protein
MGTRKRDGGAGESIPQAGEQRVRERKDKNEKKGWRRGGEYSTGGNRGEGR